MKIRSKGGVAQKDNAAGFVNIEEWEGQTMRINMAFLERAMRVLKTLEEEEFDIENVHVGMSTSRGEKHAGVFCVFLDPNKTVAYAIAGKIEDSEKDK